MRWPTMAARALAAVAGACVWLGVSPCAHAMITSVYSQTATPVPCALLSNRVRLCDESAFVPPRPRSTVKSFDGVPIDVRVAFPAQPVTGPDGPYPLIMVFHRYGGAKLTEQNMSGLLARGYATFTMTDRGFGESCGTQAARDADPSGCANGYVRMMDTRYEVRDAQELVGELVDEGFVDPQRIGATGASYGGAPAIALAALKDRKMLPDGTLVPWTSPLGTPIALAAAAPGRTWTDLVASLVPNGSTLDYVENAPYVGRTGVLKLSLENALYGSGLPFFYAPQGADPSADLTGWHTLLNAGEPYDDSSGHPLAAVSAMRDEVSAHHSAYYIDDSEAPAPLLISSGWTDDLFPADEAIRFYNRTRTRYPDTPISLFLADLGHVRGQNKPADVASMGARQTAWLDYFVKGTGSVPFQGVETRTQTCPNTAPSGGPYQADHWADLAPGEVRFADATPTTILPSAGSQSIATTFDPVNGGGACAVTSPADQPDTATYRTDPAPTGGYTLMGSPTVIADITSAGQNSQIAARLLDVDPSANTQTLVARGLWRPSISSFPVRQVFQLHPNGYRFADGHVAKLELLPKDSPYGRTSNGQANVTVANLELRLPVVEQPGSLGGFVDDPAQKFVPAGYQLARDFQAAGYPRPKGASPLRVSLVPAFQQCTAPNRTHGWPLDFPSCNPPTQASPNLTFGTPDANGNAANSSGFVLLGAVVGNPSTPADEADVLLTVSLTDVREAARLGDYGGELQETTTLRITDKANGSAGDEAGTVQDIPYPVTVPCAATASPSIGSTCSLTTGLDALVPGTVPEGKRSVWQLDQIKVLDGGPDGAASTPNNSLFAVQGVYVP